MLILSLTPKMLMNGLERLEQPERIMLGTDVAPQVSTLESSAATKSNFEPLAKTELRAVGTMSEAGPNLRLLGGLIE